MAASVVATLTGAAILCLQSAVIWNLHSPRQLIESAQDAGVSDLVVSLEGRGNHHRHPQDSSKLSLPTCMLSPLYQLCSGLAGGTAGTREELRGCYEGPEAFFRAFSHAYKPSEKEVRTRSLMHTQRIRSLSIGSGCGDACGVCGDVSAKRTMCTDRAQLDLFKVDSWTHLVAATAPPEGRGGSNHTGRPLGFDVLFAEHVLEHFHPVQVSMIAAAAFATLEPGGLFRVSVPDGYKPAPSYQNYIRPGRIPSGLGQEHMAAYTADSLPPLFKEVGFEVRMKEYFTMDGKFVSAYGAYGDDGRLGKVQRSFRHDSRNKKPYQSWMLLGIQELDAKELRPDEPMFTSLWFDAIKPASCTYVLS